MIRRSRLLARAVFFAVALAIPMGIMAPAQASAESSWDRLAQCESSGNWSANTGNGYSGGLQFTPSTWNEFGGSAYASSAAQASRDQQIAIAQRVLAGQGWGAWPTCSQRTDLS